MQNRTLEEGKIVMCTVTQIQGTVVFVKIDEYDLDGTIIFPEIAPGRIRNIREHAFPGKKIVCKVMRITSRGVELSLRRVKVNERNLVNEVFKKEKTYSAILKTVLGEQLSKEAIEKIRAKSTLYDILEASKENPKILEEFMPKDKSDKISQILGEKKEKEKVLSKRFQLSSKASDGIIKIKNIIKQAIAENKEIEVSYIAAGKYLIKVKTKNPKLADQNLRKIMQNIEDSSKKQACFFLEEKN